MENEMNLSTANHSVSINDRKNLIITGVKKIDSFDNEEFLMETTMGYIVIKGKDLEIIKLDTFKQNVSIKGMVDSLNYIEHASKKEESDNLFTKLFK